LSDPVTPKIIFGWPYTEVIQFSNRLVSEAIAFF